MRSSLSFILFIGLFFIVVTQNGVAQNEEIDSLELALRSNLSKYDQAQIHLELSELQQRSDFMKAISHAQEGLEISREHKFPELEYEFVQAIGEIFLMVGYYNKALDQLLAAQQIAVENQWAQYEAKTLNVIGNLYWYLEDFSNAGKYYKQYSKVSARHNDSSSLSIGLMNLGICYVQLQKFDSAKMYLENARTIANKIEDHYAMALCFLNLGWYYQEIEDFSKALKLYKVLENNYLDILLSNYKVDLYNSYAYVFMHLKDYDKAEIFAELGEQEARQSNSPYLLMLNYEIKYKLDSASNKTFKALENKGKYLELIAELEREKTSKSQTSFDLLIELQEKKTAINLLETERELQAMKLSKSRNNFLVVTIILILLSIISVMIVVAYRIKTKSEKALFRNNLILKEQTEELETLNEEIIAQREDLYDKNQELSTLLDQLKNTQKQLLQSEKMASVGTLAAGIAHEINNPLNFILSGISSIESVMEDIENLPGALSPSEQRRIVEQLGNSIEIAETGIDKVSGITSALATFVHHDNASPVYQNVNEILDTTLRFLNSKITESISLEKDFTELPSIKCFPGKLYQAFLNIINNAIYSITSMSDTAGIIRISTHFESVNKTVIIHFFNNGPHVAEENLKKIFDPFFTTKDPDQGKGLGLSLSYTIIDELNGQISASNTEDGVMFEIILPVV